MRFNVAGVTFGERQKVLEDFYRNKYRSGGEYPVCLMKEEGNEYDPNAVAVLLQVDGDPYGQKKPGWVQVGYVPRELNLTVRRKWDAISGMRVAGAGVSSGGRIGLSVAVDFDEDMECGDGESEV